jgi:OPA family sugar phosphate sensor protein UhpC-like MFS transporter
LSEGLGIAQQAADSKAGGLFVFSVRARIFAVTWLAYAGFYLCRKNFSVLMPFLQNQAGIPKMQLADILFAYSLCYAAGQFLMGSLADRISPRLVVCGGLVAASVANLAMSVNPVYTALLVLGMVNGLAQSTGWPGLLKIMAMWFEPGERGVVMGWWTTNYVFGGFLATIFASWAVAGGSWKRGFVLPSLLLLAIAACFALLVRDHPGMAAARAPEPPQQPDPIAGYREVIAQPVAWATAFTAFLIKITRYSFLFWLPLYFTEHLGYQPEHAGYLSSIYELAGIAGALLAGYISDKVLGARRYPIVCGMLAGLALACLLQPALGRAGWAGSLAGIALIGVMTFGADSLVQGAATQDAGGKRSAASAAGLVNGIASLGQLFSPYLVAQVATRWGWDALFSLFVVIAMLGSATAALFWSHKPAQADQPA